MIYTARAEDGTGPSLWTLDVPTRMTRRISSDLERYTSVSASRDGKRIVATLANTSASLWRVPLADRPSNDSDVQQYHVSTERAMAPRFAGTSLLYLATGGIDTGLWNWKDGEASEVKRGTEMPLLEPAAVSRDGKQIVVVQRRGGKRRLFVMSADGTNVQPLAPSLEIQGATGQGVVDWSLDGSWVVAGGIDSQGRGLFKIPADGRGSPTVLLRRDAVNPVVSPDGKLIVYGGPVVVGQTALAWTTTNGDPVDLPPVRVRPGGYRFLPDSPGLVFQPTGPAPNFWLLNLTTKATSPLTHLTDRGRILTFDITPDGKAIVFDRIRDNSDIVLFDRDK